MKTKTQKAKVAPRRVKPNSKVAVRSHGKPRRPTTPPPPPAPRVPRIGGLACTRLGSGAPGLVFVPGLGLSRHAFDAQIQYFGRTRTVIALDPRGCGDTPRPPAARIPWNPRELIEPLRQAIRESGIQKPVVVAASSSAAAALLLAAEEPDLIGGLVTVGGAARYTQTGSYKVGWTPDERDRFLRMPDEKLIPELAARTLPDDPAQVVFRLIRSMHRSLKGQMLRAVLRETLKMDVRNILKDVRVPTLVVVGDADRFAHVDEAREMAKRIKGAEVLVLDEGVGHFPYLTAASRFNQALESFIARVTHLIVPVELDMENWAEALKKE